jgi:O-antigen ligase
MSRRNQVMAYAALLFVSLAFDPNSYVGGLAHVYVHDLTVVPVAILGVFLAVRNRALVAGGRWFLAPMGLFAFVLADTVVVGALHYGGVPSDLRRLFWLEHGDGFRIVGELLVWVWALAQLRPTREEIWRILDIAVWGSMIAVAWTVLTAIATNTAHATTTTFDVDILTALPLATVFVLRPGRHALDLVRLVVIAAASAMLYSRATIVTVFFTTFAVLLVVRDWRALRAALGSLAAGYLIIFLFPVLFFGSNALTGMWFLRVSSIANQQLAPYTIPNREVIWRDAVHIWETSPVIGVGYHDYFLYSSVKEVKIGADLSQTHLLPSTIKSAHNDYLSWLSEMGVVGLLVFLAFWGSAVFLAARMWLRDRQDRVRHTFSVALFAALLGISALGEVLIPRTPDAVPSAAIWWIVLALVFLEAGRVSPAPLSPEGRGK